MKKTKKVGIVVITVEGLEKALGIDTSRNRIVGYWEEGCESKFIRLKISGEDCPKISEGKLPPEIEIETVQKKNTEGQMNPISFKEQTKILNKPEGMTDKECSPLPVWNGDSQRCISCWKGNLKERLLFLFTGKIWLWVWYGQTQPPVCVDITHPFQKTLKEILRKKINQIPYLIIRGILNIFAYAMNGFGLEARNEISRNQKH